jgi:hypothetical protein
MSVVIELVYIHELQFKDVMAFPGGWDAMEKLRERYRRILDGDESIPEAVTPVQGGEQSHKGEQIPLSTTPPKGTNKGGKGGSTKWFYQVAS